MSTPSTHTTQTSAPPVATGKRKRGRESVGDMIRSLGLVLVVVVLAWWLASPTDEDKQEIRVVDIAPTLAQLQRDVPGLPVPSGLPATWRSTVDAGDGATVRIGWVTPTEQYAEWAVALTSARDFYADETGKDAAEVGTFDVAGVTWRQLQDADDRTTLVREVGDRTLFVGGMRETTSLDELRELAAAVQP
jgi:hypothetical protein